MYVVYNIYAYNSLLSISFVFRVAHRRIYADKSKRVTGHGDAREMPRSSRSRNSRLRDRDTRLAESFFITVHRKIANCESNRIRTLRTFIGRWIDEWESRICRIAREGARHRPGSYDRLHSCKTLTAYGSTQRRRSRDPFIRSYWSFIHRYT